MKHRLERDIKIALMETKWAKWRKSFYANEKKTLLSRWKRNG